MTVLEVAKQYEDDNEKEKELHREAIIGKDQVIDALKREISKK